MIPEDEGRAGGAKEEHKNDWGSHKKADIKAEKELPTESQLAHAQQVIDVLWGQNTTKAPIGNLEVKV